MHTKRSTVLLAAGGALAVAACSDARTPTAVAPAPDAANWGVSAQAPDVATLARTIPGFGGFYLDDGIPTVYLTDVGHRPAAEAALAGFARAQGIAPSAIRVVRGDYTYRELSRWFDGVSYEAFEIPGVVFVDLDEAANRVLVGVEHRAAAAGVQGVAARLRVPAAALLVREVEPIHFAATLRDQVRPLVGGLQIRFSQFLCSLGYNAVRAGVEGFVTASHCSDRQGSADGTLYYQPLNQVANEFIGTEIADPAYQRNISGCPRGRRCRRSDANFSDRDDAVQATLGRIAKTTGPNNGSLEIAGAFTITSKGPSAVGQTVNKVGRTTGWTRGTVTRTCVTTGVSGSNIALICQDFVESTVQIVGGGDSGSNVFAITAGDNVSLRGSLWGGNSSGTLFVYSPISNVEQELGTLTTH